MKSGLPDDIPEVVRRALSEDIGSGDITASLISAAATARGRVTCREQAVICGTPWFDEVFRQLDPAIAVHWRVRDGDTVAAGDIVCELEGPARPLLTGERTALNFLQTLSGTATAARDCVTAVAGTATRILDTRKTLPGLRRAQKYATRCGGATNHRMGLYDGMLIKENHILAAGGILAAVKQGRQLAPGIVLEVEVETLEQLGEALEAGADVIMLDNFSIGDLRRAVAIAAGRAKLEASGGIEREQLREVAGTGVDYISVGAITKHVRAVDLSLRLTI